MAEITADERAIVNVLGEVWNKFLELPLQHDADNFEFCQGIHHLQQKVLARVGRRAMLEPNSARGVPLYCIASSQTRNSTEK